MYSFMLNQLAGIICVDNACYTLATGLPPNIDFAVWTADSGGRTQYNDRPGSSYPWSDPSPYEPQINAWVTAAAADTPALLLAQAKQVKSDFAQAIFNARRQADIAYSVAAGQFSWSATDDAQQELVALLAMAVGQALSDFSNGAGSALSSFDGSLNTVLNQIASTVVLAAQDIAVGAAYSVPMPRFTSVIPAQQLVPIGRTTAVNVTGAELTGLVNAMATRRKTLKATCLANQAAIALAASISDVLAVVCGP